MFRFYKTKISPVIKYLFGGGCRYLPTCSEYSKDAFEKYGFFKGLSKSTIRVLKCNPFSKGGYDPLI